MGVSFSAPHRELPLLALVSPRLTVGTYQVWALTHSHLAMLGEELLRLAAVELVWTALEGEAGGRGAVPTEPDAAPDALPHGAAASAPAAASMADALASLLSRLGFPARKVMRAAAAAAAAVAAVMESDDDDGDDAGRPGLQQPGQQAQQQAQQPGRGAAASSGGAAASAAAALPAGAAGSAGGDLAVSAGLLNRGSALLAANVRLLVERWQLPEHMTGWGDNGSGPSKQDQATAAKALVALLYLDGGYAGAVRPALAPLLAELLARQGAAGGADADADADLQEVGRRLARMQQWTSLPRHADDLHAAAAAVAAAAPRAPRRGPRRAAAEAAEGAEAAGAEVDGVVSRLHGPPPHPRSSPAAALRAVLEGLEAHGRADGEGQGYAPRDVERFLALSDLWYGYLTGFAATGLSGATPPLKGDDRQRHVTAAAAAARALLVLGRAVYGVAVSELVLERALRDAGGPGGGGLTEDPLAAAGPAAAAAVSAAAAGGSSRRVWAASVDALRREREGLMAERVRLVQMEAALGLRAAAGGGSAAGEGGVTGAASYEDGGWDGEEDVGAWGAEDDDEAGGALGFGGVGAVVGGGEALLARCADGVLGAVALEGGVRHARLAARGMVAAGEVAETMRMLEGL